MKDRSRRLMAEAIRLSTEKMLERLGGPFGAVVARGSEVVARGSNQVTSANDPTAHAEIVAIREACRSLGAFRLEGCELYASCEPCPMCFAAASWARIERIFYAATREDAARSGFADAAIHREVALPPAKRRLPMVQIMRSEALEAFERWEGLEGRVEY